MLTNLAVASIGIISVLGVLILRLICGTFEVFTDVFDIHLWNIIGRLNVQLIKKVQVCLTVQLCHSRVTFFPVYMAVSTFFLYGRATRCALAYY